MTNPLTIIQRKRWLAEWARRSRTTIPAGFRVNVPVMGEAARELLKSFQLRCGLFPTGIWNAETVERLRAYLSLVVIEHIWRPAKSYTRRPGKPKGVIFHHAAATDTTVEKVNSSHISRGMNGIGYHYFVTKEGDIHRGRPEWAIGAHALGYNDWLGVCAEGNYEVDLMMPAVQLSALRALRGDIERRYGLIAMKRHRDVNATACPGRNYPWVKVLR